MMSDLIPHDGTCLNGSSAVDSTAPEERPCVRITQAGQIDTTLNELTSCGHLTGDIIAAMGDGLCIVGLDFRVIYQNKVHEELTNGNFAGSYCFKSFHQQTSICPECPVQAAFADGRVHRQRKANKAAGQTAAYVEITASPLFDNAGELIAGIEIVRNISDQENARAATEKLNRVLLQKTDDLLAANDELEAFSYSLSHDMRTFLAQLQLAVEALTESPHCADEKTLFFINIIKKSVDGMDQLIASMLELAQASTGELRHDHVNLGSMADEILETLAMQNPDRLVKTIIPEDLTANGEGTLLYNALQNLLGNAWKFTMDAEEAKIELGKTNWGDEVVYFIRDNGCGFDQGDAEKIFQPFERLARSKHKGNGIGLATVKRILTRHGGRVWAESASAQGATFYFTLPDPE